MKFRSALPAAILVAGFVAAAASTRDAPGGGSASGLSPLAGAGVASSDARWDIPVVRNRSVLRYVRMFTQGSQQDEMALYLKRSGRYEAMIRSRLRARGMPEDLVYLSLIESGFNPTARSSASAVGLWQFMAPTARDYGLRVDGYVDERRDPERATDAALRYLRDLYAHFGSWGLAAAAYNTGQGRVERVMKSETGKVRGDENAFWLIRHRLPRETREYVPLMMAAALIGKEPHKYGMEDVARWMPLQVDSVEVPGGTTLRTLGEAVGASENDLARLNPHLVQRMTPPGKPFPVRIPSGGAAAFATNWSRVHAAAERETELARAQTRARTRTASRSTHVVRRGESLWTIARRNDLTVAQLKRANNLRASTVRPGQRLSIPRGR